MNKGILILGATSAIARATAIAFAKKGFPLFLAARNTQELQRIASDIAIKFGIEVKYGAFDADDFHSHEQFIAHTIKAMDGNLGGVVIAFGDMGEHKKAINDFTLAEKIITRNYTGAVSVLTPLANILAQQKSGFIIGISSVAGDRGRQSNYLYGSAKGAFSIFLQGLRNRLAPLGVRVITIKPGFVDTQMTFGMPGLFCVASPEYIGEHIVKALNKGSDIVYVPWFWKYIMFIIKMIPEKLFKRLKL